MNFKDLIRKGLNILHLDITKNLKYDRLTKTIISKVVTSSSLCIDIGCHKGEILDLILYHSPNQKHYGFEPIPILYNDLKNKYEGRALIYPFALSDHEGRTTFQFVKNAPAFSGIRQREYSIKNPLIEEIPVTLAMLDNVIPLNEKIAFIKIDVEGGEFGVLKGAKNTIVRNKPIIIFECGLGASDYYNTKPEDLFTFLTKEIHMNVSLLDRWLKGEMPLTENEFCSIFYNRKEYYFIAYPSNK